MTTKQRADLLAKLGYGGNKENPYEIIEWINKSERFDIVALPRPSYKWQYMVVILGNADKKCGKLKLDVFCAPRYHSDKRRCLFAGIDSLITTLSVIPRKRSQR
jgi:hypothetical protein